jgi:hypothetical protein
MLREITGYQRNRRYRYEPYLALFEPGIQLPGAESEGSTTIQTTESMEEASD